MARIVEPSDDELKEYRDWVASRPPAVRAVAERFEPWGLYRMKSTGQRVTIEAFVSANDGTVTLTVAVSGQFNLVAFERAVFGVPPDDLEPCELPADDELTGAALTPEQVEENIDVIRVRARPDLWVLDEHGKAVRKQ